MRWMAFALGLAILAFAGFALRDERPLTRETCAAHPDWGRERFNDLLGGGRPEPYGPHDGEQVAAELRGAALPLPAENDLFRFTEFLRLPGVCDFRWFAETNVFAEDASHQGQVKLFVLATPELAAIEEKERARLARKYEYAHAMALFRNGNVVVEYFFQLATGTPVRRNRVEDVRRIVADL